MADSALTVIMAAFRSQTHIGTTTSATAYLLQSLSRAAKERAVEFEQCSGPELKGMPGQWSPGGGQ
jgi:hypothetical protein